MDHFFTNSHRTQRFAVGHLHLPDGRTLRNQVVVVTPTPTGLRYSYHALNGEEAFTEWRGGEFTLPGEGR